MAEARLLHHRTGTLTLGGRTLVMGVVNVTPDSFSDGGVHFRPEDAVAGALRLAAEGADILDIGGESTRPGYSGISPEEEWRRVQPVLEGLARSQEALPPLSIDSTKAEVARRALAAGADGVAAYVPWFYPVTQVQVRQHFLALLDAADGAPAFLYNIPPRTVNDLDPALAGELASAGFAGMKDSTGDFARHEAYLDAVSGNGSFELFTGTEPLAVRSIEAGAAGVIGALLNCAPELFTDLRDALAAGDTAETGRLHDQISLLKEQIKREESTVAAIKRRVRDRLAKGGVDYPAAPRAPFT
ncbi:MAG: dihydrodipicolinate synthase family protein [Microvirga sp.]